MAKPFSKSFYESRRWRRVAKTYAASQHFVCERCQNQKLIGKPPEDWRFIVHHKTPLTPTNINDPYIAYGWDNLEFLCQCCHNQAHGKSRSRECVFDDDGNPVGIIEYGEA